MLSPTFCAIQDEPQQLLPRDVKRQALESLIMLRLQIARASDTGIRVSDADVDWAAQRRLQQIAEPAVPRSQQGTSYDEFRKSLR